MCVFFSFGEMVDPDYRVHVLMRYELQLTL